MDGTIAQEGLRPPSLAIFEASPRLAGRTCLSLSFSGEGGSSSGVPSGQESHPSGPWVLQGLGKSPGATGLWFGAAVEPGSRVGRG